MTASSANGLCTAFVVNVRLIRVLARAVSVLVDELEQHVAAVWGAVSGRIFNAICRHQVARSFSVILVQVRTAVERWTRSVRVTTGLIHHFCNVSRNFIFVRLTVNGLA